MGAVFDFIVKNNILLIEILVGLILLAIVTLAYRNFFAQAKSELGGEVDGSTIGAIEASLKKILESTEVRSSSASTVSSSEMEGLKNSLLDKDRMIEELQFQLKTASEASLGEAVSSADVLQWQNRSKELEAKLAEYEIISEDIADLSMYKDENVKLKKEIDALKKGAAAAIPPASAPVLEEPMIPHVAVAADLAAAAPQTAEASADTGSEFGGIDDDIMAEFARAVEEQKAAAAPAAQTTEPVAVSTPPPLEAPVPDPEPVAEAEAASVDLGEMNLDAMVAEADDLASKEVAEIDQSILDVGLDTEKLAEEALTFQKVKNEDEQLMNQFEDFMKKGAS